MFSGQWSINIDMNTVVNITEATMNNWIHFNWYTYKPLLDNGNRESQVGFTFADKHDSLVSNEKSTCSLPIHVHMCFFLTSNKQEANCDRSLGNANFSRLGSAFLIRSQSFHIHFFCLRSQLLLMAENVLDNLAVVINNQRHWNAVAECEQCADKKSIIKCIG